MYFCLLDLPFALHLAKRSRPPVFSALAIVAVGRTLGLAPSFFLRGPHRAPAPPPRANQLTGASRRQGGLDVNPGLRATLSPRQPRPDWRGVGRSKGPVRAARLLIGRREAPPLQRS